MPCPPPEKLRGNLTFLEASTSESRVGGAEVEGVGSHRRDRERGGRNKPAGGCGEHRTNERRGNHGEERGGCSQRKHDTTEQGRIRSKPARELNGLEGHPERNDCEGDQQLGTCKEA